MSRSLCVTVAALTAGLVGLTSLIGQVMRVDPDLVIVDANGGEHRWSLDRLLDAHNREQRLGPIQGPARLKAGQDEVKVWIPGQCRPGAENGSSYGDPPSRVKPGAIVPLKGHKKGFYTLKVGDIEVDLKVTPEEPVTNLQISARASPQGVSAGQSHKLI